MFCANCGNRLVAGTKFCGSCGASIYSKEKDGDEQQAELSKLKENIKEEYSVPDVSSSKTIIKCGNCGFIGQGEPARRLVFKILAWSVVWFAPLLTLLYFLATHKYRCPKCQSTFLGVKNEQGIFVGQRGGGSRWVLIIVVLIVGVAIIGILASIVLASLNSARMKSRDARRVADIKQIQLALELYRDANGSYPKDIYAGSLEPIYSAPNDPLGGNYSYSYCPQNSYHLGASLEEKNNPNLSKDDDIKFLCLVDKINGSDSDKCSPADAGSHCFDVDFEL